ncbi:MAG: WD40/YVTN/BNR-like repeat-containing protein, partial [Terriglobia bacterium]
NRTPWGLTSGGPGSGLYKSEDEGVTWKQITGKDWPEGILGRIGVSVSGADPNRVYALVEAKQGGLYRSDDGGENWKLINKDHRFTQRAWYFTHVFADPKSEDTVYIMNTGTYRSTDGGHSFSPLAVPHGDNHALWIDPTNPQRMIAGNDGGVAISVDGAKTWTPQNNQPTAQFYHVVTDNRFNYYVYGAQQDNSTVAIASRTSHGTIGRQDWYGVGGGESGYIAPDPRDPNIVYAGSYDGLITRYDLKNGQMQDVTPWPENPMGLGAAGLKYRFQWTMPIVISLHDPNVIYAGGQVLFRSSDGGASWSVISPDLTRNDKSKQGTSGGPLIQDNTSVEYYDTIFAIAESPVMKGQVWVGSDDGLVHLTRDGGKTWTDVTPQQMPAWSRVDLIEASPYDAATACLAIDRHKLDDLRPYIYVTRDYGKSWSEITNGIPATSFVHAVREDPVKRGLLYAGTESGVFVSFDDGAHWQSLQLNLPTAPVRDLAVKRDDLVAATHGRAFWILDDIAPLRQLSSQITQSNVYLFKPSATYRNHSGGGFPIHGPYGQNPPGGAMIDYYLKSAAGPKDDVKLEILDSQGKTVRSYSNKKQKEAGSPLANEFPGFSRRGETLPAKAGLNRFVWDLRYKGPDPVPHHISWGRG